MFSSLKPPTLSPHFHPVMAWHNCGHELPIATGKNVGGSDVTDSVKGWWLDFYLSKRWRWPKLDDQTPLVQLHWINVNNDVHMPYLYAL